MCDKSIVEYFGSHQGYKCGYCNSEDTSFSHGMWAHILTPVDYLNLIDRGWRRSGKYCYKPTMNITCCPQYTIRCDTNQFVLSKSQKKVLKKFHNFLSNEKIQKCSNSELGDLESENVMETAMIPESSHVENFSDIMPPVKSNEVKATLNETKEHCNTTDTASNSELCSTKEISSSQPMDSPGNVGPVQPHCRKAKVIRRERKLQKLLKSGATLEEATIAMQKKSNSQVKSIEDFLSEPLPLEPPHKLELRLVPSDIENPLFSQTFEKSYAIYQKYQMAVHHDPADKCSKKQYIRFLVNSPIQESSKILGDKVYGSFHQQYWLDEKLIAVGVIDILPKCVSSVYFYYDPDYSFLSLGTYAALREIAYTRELNKRHKNLQYYYMGFYIHSCVKMRYKGQYTPSYLLCPETYIFQRIEKCKPKLDLLKYHRLDEDQGKVDCDGIVKLNEVLILCSHRQMTYPMYCNTNRNAGDDDEVQEYARLVGRKCYSQMLLYRKKM